MRFVPTDVELHERTLEHFEIWGQRTLAVAKRIGLPFGIRGTAQSYEEGYNVPCGPSGTEGDGNFFGSLDDPLPEGHTVHSFVVDEEGIRGSGTQTDRILFNTIHKCVAEYSLEHASTIDDLPILYIFPLGTYRTGVYGEDSPFEAHRSERTFPEAVSPKGSTAPPEGIFRITPEEARRIKPIVWTYSKMKIDLKRDRLGQDYDRGDAFERDFNERLFRAYADLITGKVRTRFKDLEPKTLVLDYQS